MRSKKRPESRCSDANWRRLAWAAPMPETACATGTSRFRGLSELRVKESDRLTGTAELLRAAGVECAIEGDDLLVQGCSGPPPGGGLVATQMDHRLAMSALVLGLACRAPMQVDDGAFIATSFPNFIALMNQAAGAAAISLA